MLAHGAEEVPSERSWAYSAMLNCVLVELPVGASESLRFGREGLEVQIKVATGKTNV